MTSNLNLSTNLQEATVGAIIYYLPDFVNIFKLTKPGNRILYNILADLEDF